MEKNHPIDWKKLRSGAQCGRNETFGFKVFPSGKATVRTPFFIASFKSENQEQGKEAVGKLIEIPNPAEFVKALMTLPDWGFEMDLD